MRSLIIAALALSSLATTTPARSDTLINCYATVHEGCFLQEPKCTQEEYEDLLESCDYLKADTGDGEDKSVRPFSIPVGLKTDGLTPVRRLQIQRMIRALGR
jgi:hypothetical protein